MEKIYEQLERSTKRDPKGIALRFEKAKITYEKLFKEVKKTAEKLVALGIQENDVVATNLPNCVTSVYLLYALDYLGAIAYMIHPLTPDQQLDGFLKKAKAKALFCLNIDANRLRKVVNIPVIAVNPYSVGNPLMKVLSSLKSHLSKKVLSFSSLPLKEAKRSKKDPQDTSVYLNSGGTNGEPKIIMLSSGAIANLASRGFEIINLKSGKEAKMYTVIPLFHGFGLAMGVCTPLEAGGQVILDLKFHSEKAIKRMKKGEVSIIIGVPALYNALLHNKDFKGKAIKNLVAAFVGGDSVTQTLLDSFDECSKDSGGICRLHEGYGLTETVTVSNVNTDFASKKGTVGKPLKGIEEIVISLDDQHVLGPNEEGEILISGPTLMNGYFEDEALTKETFLEINKKKYVRTKDLGFLDEEGYLHFKSRLRRIAKINGVIVCPSDLEKLALEDKGIYEAYSYASKHPRFGEILNLVLVKQKNSSEEEETIQKRILERIHQELPIYYQPKNVFFVEKLKRTAVGKVDDSAFPKE